MRILHVGWGYTPFRHGGVIVYVEDLLQALAGRGHQVHYFCAGRGDLWLAPRINTWWRGSVQIHELRNPPLWVTPLKGTRRPDLEVDHAGVRRLFRRLLRKVRPEVVHIQEFYGLPVRMVEDVKRAGIRLVITLEDLHCLCPTLLLYKPDTGENCRDYEQGRGCVSCCRQAPAASARWRLKSAAWHAAQPLRERAPALYRALRRTGQATLNGWYRVRPSNGNGHLDEEAMARAFRFRRSEFVRLLGQADVLHGLSSFLCDIHEQHGISPVRSVRLGTTVGAISQIRPSCRQPGRPLVFGFRGLFTKGKGAEVLLEAFRHLSPQDAVLHIHGFLDRSLQGAVAEAEASGRVRYFGPYTRTQLQTILDATDVGVVPSVWREGYPLVSLEYLAAGIPVIGSRIGGIPDTVVDGQNGLLVPLGDVEALRAALQRFIADPGLIFRLRQGIGPVKTMEQLVTEIEALYRCGSLP